MDHSFLIRLRRHAPRSLCRARHPITRPRHGSLRVLPLNYTLHDQQHAGSLRSGHTIPLHTRSSIRTPIRVLPFRSRARPGSRVPAATKAMLSPVYALSWASRPASLDHGRLRNYRGLARQSNRVAGLPCSFAQSRKWPPGSPCKPQYIYPNLPGFETCPPIMTSRRSRW